MLLRWLLSLLFPLLLLAYTPAGTAIYNEAFAVYFDETGQIYNIRSNIVWSVVEPIGNPIIQIETPVKGEAGQPLIIPFTLQNGGNAQDEINLSVNSLTPGLTNPAIYIDKNQNGLVDPGEPQVGPVVVGSGDSIPLLLKVQLPSPFFGGVLEIKAVSQIDGTTAIQQVIIEPTGGKGFVITKSVNRLEADWGDLLRYEIDFQNVGLSPNSLTTIETDLNNDGIPEKLSGWLIVDPLSFYLDLNVSSIQFQPTGGVLLFKGTEDLYWKSDVSVIDGNLSQLALFYQTPFQPDQEGFLSFEARIKAGTPAGPLPNTAIVENGDGNFTSNTPLVEIAPHFRVVADDTDDNNASTGLGVPTDPDDLMVIDSAVAGQWLQFENEVWNFSNKPEVINLQWDKSLSQNITPGMAVVFYSIDDRRLFDSNGDGLVDVGIVQPGQSVHFLTKVFIPTTTTATENIIFAIKASAASDPSIYDYTFDKINSLVRNNIVVVYYKTLQNGVVQTLPLANKEVVGYEIDSTGKVDNSRVFFTDSSGAVMYEQNGEKFYLYTGMRDGYTYRLSVRSVDGLNYYLSPPFKKSYFDTTPLGSVQCWSWGGRVVPCTSDEVAVKVDASSGKDKILSFTLLPSGVVMDAVYGNPISGACVHLYKCSDSTCNSYTEVTTPLNLYPDVKTTQTNPQISGDYENVGKNPGEFQFLFNDYNDTMKGWYWVGVDYTCGEPSLGNSYYPIKLQKDRVFDPNSGEFYNGEKFYIDGSDPGAILMRILLWTRNYKGLILKKSASVSGAFIGDFVKWTITLTNPNSNIAAYDVVITDYLPEGVVWKSPTDYKPQSISSDGRQIKWYFPVIEGGQTITISYWTYIGVNAPTGTATNRVIAKGWTNKLHSAGQMVSNWAFASIQISKGIFSEKGTIFGRVFLDDNYNRIPDFNESGIKGVRIYLDDGRFAITDSRGKFHFDNVSSGTHVLKLDQTTLIKGVYTAPVNPFSSQQGDMQIVEVHPGEMVKANFRVLPQLITHTAVKKYKNLDGVFKIERDIKGIFEDAKTKKGFVKNRVVIINRSKFPLYEVSYWELSPLRPMEGSVYLNGSPYYPPTNWNGGFRFTIPLIQPHQRAVLEWTSKIPKKGGKGIAQIGLQLNPIGDRYKEKFHLPVTFAIPAPKEYRITVYFPFGSAKLTETAKRDLLQLVSYLRRKDYQSIIIKIEGNTDATRNLAQTNLKLSEERADAVKKFLKEHLIEISKVKVVR